MVNAVLLCCHSGELTRQIGTSEHSGAPEGIRSEGRSHCPQGSMSTPTAALTLQSYMPGVQRDDHWLPSPATAGFGTSRLSQPQSMAGLQAPTTESASGSRTRSCNAGTMSQRLDPCWEFSIVKQAGPVKSGLVLSVSSLPVLSDFKAQFYALP